MRGGDFVSSLERVCHTFCDPARRVAIHLLNVCLCFMLSRNPHSDDYRVSNIVSYMG